MKIYSHTLSFVCFISLTRRHNGNKEIKIFCFRMLPTFNTAHLNSLGIFIFSSLQAFNAIIIIIGEEREMFYFIKRKISASTCQV
jgi:hypothetical protein